MVQMKNAIYYLLTWIKEYYGFEASELGVINLYFSHWLDQLVHDSGTHSGDVQIWSKIALIWQHHCYVEYDTRYNFHVRTFLVNTTQT